MRDFILCSPASSGLSLAIARHLFKTTTLPIICTTRSSDVSNLRKLLLKPFTNNHSGEAEGKKKQEPIFSPDPNRLHFTRLDFTNESTIRSAAEEIPTLLGVSKPVLRWAWVTPGILHPERKPDDLDYQKIKETFDVNVIGHLLMIKYFSKYLPRGSNDSSVPSEYCSGLPESGNAVWINMSARIGSISDNRLGGWYSYRASKAALNQVTKTFDIYLRQKGGNAMCVGMHPGTVKTGLGGGEFWEGVQRQGKLLMGPAEAAEKVVGVVRMLRGEQGGRCWDWKGEEVLA